VTRIAVLTDDARHLVEQEYLVNHLIERWRTQDIDVVVSDGAGGWPDADTALLHVDRTRVPDSFQALGDRYPAVINLRGTDMSKRVVSRNLLQEGDGWSGPVIVKTDANAGGHRERSLTYRAPFLGLVRRVRDRTGNWQETGVLHTSDYPIYAGACEVPPAVWRNPGLVVERFLPERRADEYVLRQWMFLGDREVGILSFGPEPIVKAANVTSYEALDEVPESLRLMRAQWGLDYGKFDYVLHDGEAVLLDANRTPTSGAHPSDAGRVRIRHLAEGVSGFLA
jgi:hypothetical protein